MSNRNFETELLYFGHGHTAGTALHSHAYFQLEYCIGGSLTALGDGKTLTLNPGDYWLIPPGIKHKFYRNRSLLNYI
ncbi:MAG: cupin domain-containing protein, partial [Lentisphaeria bacterium]|nr:cupin domain-containing protein [Lentisphaeria bacterium]